MAFVSNSKNIVWWVVIINSENKVELNIFYLSMNKTRVERSCYLNNNKGWPKGDADNKGDRVGGFFI